jgi:hypothetical protein
MSAHALERQVLPGVHRINSVATDRDELSPLSLRAELFMISHSEDTGEPHRGKRSATAGLAAAVLLELWFAGRIHIGWRYDVQRGGWVPDPGRIGVLNTEPTGDPIADTALHLLWRSGTIGYVRDFLREFATPDLYERSRAYLIACGLLRRTDLRRFGFFRRRGYVPAKPAFPVRARSRVREIATRRREVTSQYDEHYLALAALVTALGLTQNLRPPAGTPTRLARRLREIVGTHADPAIRDTANALAPGSMPPPPASH